MQKYILGAIITMMTGFGFIWNWYQQTQLGPAEFNFCADVCGSQKLGCFNGLEKCCFPAYPYNSTEYGCCENEKGQQSCWKTSPDHVFDHLQ